MTTPSLGPHMSGTSPASHQPNHPRPERFASFAPWEPGIEGPFIPPVIVPVTWGYDPPPAVLRWPTLRVAAGTFLEVGAIWEPFFYLVPSGADASDFAVYVAISYDFEKN